MSTKIYLASPNTALEKMKSNKIKYILETYYIFDNKTSLSDKLKNLLSYIKKKNDDFLLDSGAFTFLYSKSNTSVSDIDSYVERYGKFVKDNNIKYYFEMDIDHLGLDNVERWRKRLEEITGRKCIPVWHFERGIDYWKKMCEEYSYIAIGGLTKTILNENVVENLKKLVMYAHSKNVRVHGLGFTSLKNLETIKFDTVDSTSWIASAKFGSIPEFKNGIFKTVTNKKIKNNIQSSDLFDHGLKVWKQIVEYYD